jgi:hypothetical protein
MDIVFDYRPNSVESVVYGSQKKNELYKVEPGRLHLFDNISIFDDTFADEMIGYEMHDQQYEQDCCRNSLKQPGSCPAF